MCIFRKQIDEAKVYCLLQLWEKILYTLCTHYFRLRTVEVTIVGIFVNFVVLSAGKDLLSKQKKIKDSKAIQLYFV